MANLPTKDLPEVQLQDFQPDSSPTTPGILIDMQGAFPSPNGFQAMNSAVQFLNGGIGPNGTVITGSTLAYYSDGSSAVFAGSPTHLYGATLPVTPPLTVGLAFGEVDNGQTFAATTPWQFTQFGDDVIATAGGVAPQVATGSHGTFKALAGSPPFGAINGVSAGGTMFLFLGQQWFNSATGTDNNFVPNIQTQAGTGFLYDFPGAITAGATLYRNVIFFKQNATWIGQFQGQSTAAWSFQLISSFTGTWGQGCVVQLPNAIAFVGTDDFYLTTGYTPQAIPNKLKKWFFANWPLNYRQFTTSQFDPENAVIYWYFVSNNNAYVTGTGGTVLPDPIVGPTQPFAYPDRFVSYNTRTQRWGTGYTDPLFTMPVPLSVPTMPSFNTSFFLKQVPVPNVQPTIYQTSMFQRTGPPGTMSLSTGYMGEDYHLSELLRVRFKFNTNTPFGFPSSGNLTLIPYNTDSIGHVDADNIGGIGVLAADNWFHVRQLNRYHRFQVSTTGPCEIMSFSFEAREAGTR